MRPEARGTRDGELFIELFFQDELHDRGVLEGDPEPDLRWKGSVHDDIATSAMVQSSLRPLLAAAGATHEDVDTAFGTLTGLNTARGSGGPG